MFSYWSYQSVHTTAVRFFWARDKVRNSIKGMSLKLPYCLFSGNNPIVTFDFLSVLVFEVNLQAIAEAQDFIPILFNELCHKSVWAQRWTSFFCERWCYFSARGHAISPEQLCPKYTHLCSDQEYQSKQTTFDRVRVRACHEANQRSREVR